MKKSINNIPATQDETLVLEVSVNEIVEESVNSLVQEAIKHFNTIKVKVRDPEDDARYFYSEEELNRVLKEIIYPDKIWVSTVTDDKGDFFAYRIGRIVTTKKKGEKRV